MPENETRLRVRYAETDQMGVVYHANYFVWMELGRVELCRNIGMRYRDLETDEGIFLAVAEAHCRYVFPARYDEEVIVETKIAQVNPRIVRFTYEMRSEDDNRRLALGGTTHVFLNREMRPVKLPPKYLNVFTAQLEKPVAP